MESLKIVAATELAIVLKFPIFFAVYYLYQCYHLHRHRPENVYRLSERDFAEWYKRKINIQFGLFVGYFLMFIIECFGNLQLLYWIILPLIMVVILYILRMKNDMERINKGK